MADALRGAMDAADYKRVMLGFCTSRYVVDLRIEMLEPYRCGVHDPSWDSSGLFVQPVAFRKSCTLAFLRGPPVARARFRKSAVAGTMGLSAVRGMT